jgi:iron complex outermembrane receptor protein
MKYYITILLLGFVHIIIAQHTVKGTITDKLTQEPLAGVEIYAPEIHKGTTSDFDGNFILKNLPNKKIQLVFSFLGYKTQTVNIDKKVKTQNIILEASETHLDEIVISTPFNKLQSQNVMKVEHQNIKALKEMGSNTLIEGIANMPGVAQISTGTSIGKPVIRGLTGNRVLVYAQGVRLENQQFGDEHGLGINESGIGSVEVIKGPASLLYGSDALGGVLYFNDEKFANTNKTNAELSEKYFSNTQGLNTSAMVKSSTDNFKIIGRITYDTHQDYKIAKGNKVTNTRYKENDYKIGIGYSNNKFSSTLRYNYNHLNLGINEDGITEQSTSRNPEFPRQQVYNHIVSLHNHVFFNTSKLDANFGYLYNDRSEFEDSNTPNMQLLLNTFNYDLKYFLPEIKGIETIIGVQGMQQTNRNKAEETLIPDADIQDFGVFTTGNYEWKTNVVQAGIRFDNRKINSHINGIDNSYNSFNASLGYKTEPLKNTILRLNVATGFRAPNLAELASDGVHEGTSRYEKGNPNLNNEQNLQTDIALTYKNEHIELFANGFYNSINQYIYLSPTNTLIDETPVYNYIQDDANLYGGEFGFDFHPHPLDWLHLQSSYETVIAKQKNEDYLPLIPANKINTTIKSSFDIKNFKDAYFSINLQNIFNQDNISQFETKSNGYNLINLGFGSTIQLKKMSLDFSLNANNLFDIKYISHLSRLKSNAIPNPGRNISFGIDFKF